MHHLGRRRRVSRRALRQRLEIAESQVRRERARVHDVVDSAAGLASAAQLLSSGTALDPALRERLLRMMAAEGERLEAVLRTGARSSSVA